MSTAAKSVGADCYVSDRVFDGSRRISDAATAADYVARAKASAAEAKKAAETEKTSG